MEEYSKEIFSLLKDDGAHIYFCGLKGMMPGVFYLRMRAVCVICAAGITEMLQRVAKAQRLDFDKWLKGLKETGQWHVEVY